MKRKSNAIIENRVLLKQIEDTDDLLNHLKNEVVVVPIHEPGKDDTNPGNYSLIALTSDIFKITERIINDK